HFSTAMLVTHGKDGSLRARPMSLASVQDDGDLWFATGVMSSKTDELLVDSRVVVVLENSTRHVSISGDAEVVISPEKANALWSETWRPWFPAGPHDPELCLIHVRTREAEYWDMGGIRGIRYLFDAVKHVVQGERMGDDADPDQHSTIPLT
ncbi:MAG TPA: pyridoxamine 5'-phosphate oxidase family protein, partial [Polyangiaceae bacterium]|nr:pyridoxamine 5'-phosphate oxidase family protein [Polyangiaceae bacterium]